MRRILFLAVTLVLPILIGLFYSQYVKSMNVYYNSKDLPEYGLIIVKPSDPEFNLLFNNFSSGNNITDLEKIKPFSIFLKNNNSKAVVAHTITWRFVDSEGQITDRKSSYINSPALTDGIIDTETDEEYNETIPAGGYKFLTIAPKSFTHSGGGGNAEYDNKTDLANTNQKISEDEQRQRSLDSSYSNLVKDKSEVVVVLDGVFFEDGLFVGADTSDFFNMVAAHVRAKRDLVSLINESLKNVSTINSLDDSLKSKSEINLGDSRNLFNSEDQYNRSTKTFARYFSKLKQIYGNEGLIAEIDKSKENSLPEIRK